MEETNRQLAAFIKTIEQTKPNAVDGSTNDGDLQTTPELLKRDHPALSVLKQHIREAMQAYARTLFGQECQYQRRLRGGRVAGKPLRAAPTATPCVQPLMPAPWVLLLPLAYAGGGYRTR